MMINGAISWVDSIMVGVVAQGPGWTTDRFSGSIIESMRNGF